MDLEAINKKSVIGPVISVFVMVLVVSILAGLTFLFVSQLKTQVLDTTPRASLSVSNETSVTINDTLGYQLTSPLSYFESSGTTIVMVTNSTGTIIPSTEYQVTSTGFITNATVNASMDAAVTQLYNVTYSFSYIEEDTAYNAVNDTEAAGATVINYLSLIFLAVIFGAILTLVLRIILPYINLGKQMDGF